MDGHLEGEGMLIAPQPDGSLLWLTSAGCAVVVRYILSIGLKNLKNASGPVSLPLSLPLFVTPICVITSVFDHGF